MTELAERLVCRPRVSPKQGAFLRLPQRFTAYVGGRGAGKSVSGVLKAIANAGKRRCTGVVISPTYGNLEDTCIPAFRERAHAVLADFNISRHMALLTNGSTVFFRSAEKPDAVMRGLNASWAWIDEAALIKEYTWRIVLPAIREFGEAGPVWITTTPRGKDWIWARWAPKPNETPEQRAHREARYGIVHATTRDNCFLSATVAADLEEDYGVGWFARQELAGEFCDPEGTLFRREWFRVAETLPAFVSVARGWDLAVSTKAAADYTVGVKVGVTADADVYVLDVVRIKTEWPDARGVIVRTAQLDGPTVTLCVESVAFQLAAVQELRRESALMLHTMQEIKADRDKLSHALPVASRAQAGKVYIVPGAWNAAFLDEVCAFSGDGSGHDDQVDGLTIAYRGASKPPFRIFT